jgi:hypothetical protein
MWIEAILTPRDCADFIGSMTPLMVNIDGPDRVLFVARPKRIEIVPNKGLRLTTAGHVSWMVAGLRVPVTVRIASLLLTPSIESRRGLDTLCFRARVEQLDFKILPDFVDSTLVHRVNDALAKLDEVMVWRFSERLDYHYTLPKRVESADAIDIHVRWGRVKITHEALVLALSFDVRATRHRGLVHSPRASHGAAR